MEKHRKEASERRRRQAEASPASQLSKHLSVTHTPRDFDRMSTPSPQASSPVGMMNRIEARQAANEGLSPTVHIVNQGFDSPYSWQSLTPESNAILESLLPPEQQQRQLQSTPAVVGVATGNPGLSPIPTARGPILAPPRERGNTGGKQPRQRRSPPALWEPRLVETTMEMMTMTMGALHGPIGRIYKMHSSRCLRANADDCANTTCNPSHTPAPSPPYIKMGNHLVCIARPRVSPRVPTTVVFEHGEERETDSSTTLETVSAGGQSPDTHWHPAQKSARGVLWFFVVTPHETVWEESTQVRCQTCGQESHQENHQACGQESWEESRLGSCHCRRVLGHSGGIGEPIKRDTLTSCLSNHGRQT